MQGIASYFMLLPFCIFLFIIFYGGFVTLTFGIIKLVSVLKKSSEDRKRKIIRSILMIVVSIIWIVIMIFIFNRAYWGI